MKSIFKSMSCLVLGAMIVTPMFAQQKKLYPELEGPGPVVIISKDKNGKEELINVFEETQRPHFHDPRAPRFLLTDQQGKFALGIGGYLKTTMEYDYSISPKSSASLFAKASPRRFSPTMTPWASIKYIVGTNFTLYISAIPSVSKKLGH
jgi:hypothetical protein